MLQRKIHKKQKLLEGNFGDHLLSLEIFFINSFFSKKKDWVIYISILCISKPASWKLKTSDKMLFAAYITGIYKCALKEECKLAVYKRCRYKSSYH